MTKGYRVTEADGVAVVGEGVGFERIRRSQGIWLGHSIGLTMENGQKKMTV